MAATDSTRTALLDHAQELAQTRGYNAFSFRDLSERVGVTTASIHYHFPSKADLGRELAIRYREALGEHTRQIESRSADPAERLDRFVGVLRSSLQKGTRMCLCGMFASEFATLPGPVQDEARLLIESCERWLASVLAAGKAKGQFRFEGDPLRAAQGLFASLQGGMMTACAFGDESRFLATAERALTSLKPNT